MVQSESIREQRLLKATEVAKILNISRALAYRLMRTAEIPVIRFGRTVRVKSSDLEAFIDKCKINNEKSLL